jgi:hypothetical protein
MMIPGQWEGRPRPAMSPSAELPTTQAAVPPVVNGRSDSGPRADPAARELPGWEKAAIFAAVLLAASWLVMWLDVAGR